MGTIALTQMELMIAMNPFELLNDMGTIAFTQMELMNDRIWNELTERSP